MVNNALVLSLDLSWDINCLPSSSSRC